VTPHEKQFPTQGDLCREQLRRRGIPYFGDVQADVARRLSRLSPEARAAFAVACAERVMRRHERLPSREQRPFALGWRPVLDAIWQGLERGDEQSARRVRDALANFHASPYDHDDGPDGLDDADDDAAAASIYAAECFAGGDAQSAKWAAGRGVDLAFSIADDELQLDPNDFVWDPEAEPMPFAKEAMHHAVQEELRRQVADLELLERHGVSAAVLDRLKSPAAA
jgi:hypothetical protein